MIDPLQLKLTELYEAALREPTRSRGVTFEIVDAMLKRIIELEHKVRNQSCVLAGLLLPEAQQPKPDVATAVRRAAELSVDHILAWCGQGTSSNMAKSMCEEIERNMIAALKEAK